MDKYKILINRANTSLFRDIFMNLPDDFFCLSTSEYWDDIKGHCRSFEPDAFVYVLEEEDQAWLNHFKNLRDSLSFAKLPIIVITTEEKYKTFDTAILEYIDHVILRPISITNLFSEIKLFFIHKAEKEAAQEALARAQEAAKAKATGFPEADDGRKSILVVDDDKNILKLLKAALEPTYSVVTMVVGRMAEKYLETRTCDLILLDYQMPGETGPEVFAKIKQIETAKDIPVVFLTGVADKEKIAEVLKLKPQGYLLKPIDAEKLFDTIERIIG